MTNVAERTGVKKQTLYDILNEESDTTDEIVARIAKAFEVEPPTVVLAPSGSFADWLETLPGDERLAKSVALHWHDLIVEHKLPWDDMIALLQAEATWLRDKKHYTAAADTHALISELMKMADETGR